jgi:hypothetical protein
VDKALFRKYALNPELAFLINGILPPGTPPLITTNRTDIAAIFIPDLIKVDLSTSRVRLAGGGTRSSDDPDDPGDSRLGIFEGEVLNSHIQDPFAPWCSERRKVNSERRTPLGGDRRPSGFTG